MKPVTIGNLRLDGSRLFLIAGPCVIEEYERTKKIGETCRDICAKLGIDYIFKASFDKANRSSYQSFRGPGLEKGLAILARLKEELRVPVFGGATGTGGAGLGYFTNSRVFIAADGFSLRRG